MQLNVKIDDEIYKAAKQAAKAEDMRLRLYVERALNDQESVRRLLKSAAWEEALKLLSNKDGTTGVNAPTNDLSVSYNDCAPQIITVEEQKTAIEKLRSVGESPFMAWPITHPTDGAKSGEDDCTPSPEAHVKARGKKKIRGLKPVSAKPSSGGVRPKIDISRLLP